MVQVLESRALLAAFGSGNVVVYRVGTGTGNLVNTGNSVFLDEFSPSGALVQSLAMPSSDPDGAGPGRALVASGVATSEGGLSRSGDGRFLLIPGYAATSTSGSLANTNPSSINRVVARVDATGSIDTTTSFNDGGSNNIRSAASGDGSLLWVGTAGGGVRTLSLGNSGNSTGISTLTNVRFVQVNSGQLYASSSSGTSRLGTVGTGLPTTSGQAFTNLPGFPTDASSSPYGFFFADLSTSVAGDDTLYVSDDSAFALRKYSLVSGSWTLNGTIGVSSDSYRGLTGTVSGSNVTLYATRKGGSGSTGGGELVRLVDSSGYGGTLTGTPTVLATAASNTAFRGVALAPVTPSTNVDLTIGLAAPATATTNVAFQYSLTVGNQGAVTASGVTATVTLPAGLTFQSASGPDGFTGSFDPVSRLVTFSGGAIAAGGSSTLSVSALPGTAGTYTVPGGGAIVDPANGIAESNETNNATITAVTVVVTTPITNTPPTIVADTTNTTRFLSVSAAGPATVGGVLQDPTDPARTLGIAFVVGDAESSASSLSVTAVSGNLAVVPAGNLFWTGTGASRTLKIQPVAVGYSTITVTVSDGQASASYTIQYAASAASVTPSSTVFPSGASDASTAIAVDAQYTLVGDDEDQALRLYRRDQSGLPVAQFDFTASLGLTDLSGGVPREVDLEAATRLGNLIYWLGSHSNSASGELRPNRSRMFVTSLSGTGASTTLTYAGRYDHLKSDLLAWDATNGHGLGANHYGLTTSAADGVLPEADGGAGFNLEGLTMAPDGTTAYLAFRAPLAVPGARSRALIVPVSNWASLANVGGGTAGSALFGTPIELDLGGRGIREIQSNGSQYVIIAGPASSSGSFQLYTWSGLPADAPIARAEITGLNPEGIVQVPSGSLSSSTSLQLVSDLGDTVFYGDSVIGKDLVDHLQKFRIDTVVLGTPSLKISQIQGAGHTSPWVGQSVSNVSGIVTAVRTNGFYLQDPNPDGNDATSEAIFVFTSSAPTVAVGQSVKVSGSVMEFQPGGAGTGNLTTTEIVSPVIQIVTSGNSLPAPVIIGSGGRVAPTEIIDNDGLTVFDPTQDGIDFYESLEGMLIEVPNAVATGPTSSFGEISILPNGGAGAGLRTPRGGIIIQPADFNPERILLDDALVPLPDVNTGANLGTVVGVLDYSFGNFKLLATTPPTATGGVTRETSSLVGNIDALTVAAFNAENLDPSDGAAKFSQLAAVVVSRLRSPDILTIEEVQDNNGATNNSVVDASTTFQLLLTAIQDAGGPAYQYRQIDPVDDQDGGEPGGNIRVGFLFNPTRVSFVDRSGGTSTSTTTVMNVAGRPVLSASPGRIDPTNPAFNSSRKPLVGEFTFQGETVFVVANHWNSKGGDRPLYGQSQPPVLSSEVQRNKQAQIVQTFVNGLLAIDPGARVVVAGDLNDFHFSNPLRIVTGEKDLVSGAVVDSGRSPVLTSLVTTLPTSERYTYVFDGNSQDLDQILASQRLLNEGVSFDVVHVNSEFHDQVSDHDPLLARFVFQFAPQNLDLVGSSVVENSLVGTSVGTVSASDLNVGDTLTYTLPNSAGDRFALSTTGGVTRLLVNGPLDYETATSHSIVIRATDSTGRFVEQSFTLSVTNLVYEPTTFDVQRGQIQRSFVRYADLFFQDTTAAHLAQLVSGGRVQLSFLGFQGTGNTLISLAGRLSSTLVAGGTGKLALDMGIQGIGGNRNSNAGDGYYRLRVDLDGDGTFETSRTFFRLLGDLNGDRAVTTADRDLLATLSGPYNPERDVNGDGVVDARDRLLIRTGVLLPWLAIDD
jgi:uncharacterized repeat protein (TIGR01451 family)